ncbi:MutS like ABC ATPase [Cryptosporidium canis]|uniref:MutS like ABC ATPase n=1 Tax=Cryptosporidium canis TaxID=195482 RepID=A0ABQ8P8B2_9CRYT|nr:MutS like ABC ATPase [Cryptosporidium canis]KAJ1615112.1 MutS like ABC ATPase [Cryptosporidium canis]
MSNLTDVNFGTRVFCSIVAKQTISEPRLGISFFDVNSGVISVINVEDNEQLSELESLLVRVKPSSVVYAVQKECLSLKRLRDIVDAGSSWTSEEIGFPKPAAVEDFEDIISPLLRRPSRSYGKELEDELIRQSMLNLVRHFQLVQSRENNSQCEVKFLVTNSFMRMDSACVHSLKIFPGKGESSKASTHIFGMLNKTRTKVGSRRLEQWLRQPLVDEKQISSRQDVVEFFCKNDLLRQRLYGIHLRKVCDLDQIAVRFRAFASLVASEGSKPERDPKFGLEDLVKLYDSVVQSGRIFSDIKEALEESGDSASSSGLVQSVHDLVLVPLESTLNRFRDYIRLVEKTVDLEEADKGNYLITPCFTPELERLSEEKSKIQRRIEAHRKELDSYLCGERGCSEGSREAVRVIRGEGVDTSLCFRVTRRDIEFFQDKKRFKQVRINKNDYIFRTNELMDLSDREERIMREYNVEQAQVLVKALSVAATYWSLVSRLSGILGSIDVLLSFSITSLCAPIPFVRPKMVSGECCLAEDAKLAQDGHTSCTCRFYCRELRHPLIESQGAVASTGQFVANDVDLHRHGNLLSIITGPNMGGKSTYIRQIAICSLLAQIGCFVPAQEAQVPIMDQLMCRVGASDAQTLGISTFFAEMIEASAILRSATKNTLVIVDELGRGTSTFDGFGLAWSIASYLVGQKKCYTLFATHFHELSSLASSTPNVTNLRVTASTSRASSLAKAGSSALKFLYKVEQGFADKSLGVDVAELSGLPVETVKRSREKSEELTLVEQIYVDPQSCQNKKRLQLMDIATSIRSNLETVLSLAESCTDASTFREASLDSIENLRKILAPTVVSN